MCSSKAAAILEAAFLFSLASIVSVVIMGLELKVRSASSEIY